MNDRISKDEKIRCAYSSGREKGFEALYEAYYADIYFFLLNMSADPELALDLAHDTFVKAYGQEDVENFKIKAWLFKVASNAFFEYKRSYYRRIRYCLNNLYRLIDPPCDAEAGFFESVAAADEKTRLRAALKKLDEKDRAVITLRFYSGLSYGEIAGALEIEHGTVMSRLHRAKEKLKEVMKDEK